ncbi:MAG: S41 family peptidase [Salinivirgaceae bacterium]|jgi:carboxyl-terminal processing protease|nr:S41 family peptidase [Salinivirgaceae bacterium]
MGFFNKLSKVGMPLVIALSVILGMFVQQNIDVKKLNFQLRSKEPKNKLDATLNYIDSEYVDSVDVPGIVEKTIPIILENLDPHSIYIPAKDVEAMNEPLEGNFDGIGVQFNIQKDTVAVIKTIFGGPSEKVGLKDGDRIVKVNDSLIAGIGITNTQVMNLLRGKKGTKVVVGIFRRGESKLIDFTIMRDRIPLYSVDVSYMLDDNTGYIKISKFAKTTYKEFQDAIAKLSNKGMTNVVLDLRSNSGGFLTSAINIADEFLEKGKLIVYTEGRARSKSSYFATHRASCNDLGVSVLIDEWSASASEIVSGAIQDNDRGLIVGRRSFGKGLVQEPVAFADGSGMRLTIARYYTPAGRCIQRPYENGQEDYYTDIHKRFMNGEFLEQDSIQFPDSLKYYTSEGRVVYGGGGIMPDKFIPADTNGTSEYLAVVRRKGLEYQFSFEFTDKNRGQLSSFKSLDELTNYVDNQRLLEKFIIFAEKNGVKPNKSDLKESGKTIEVQIKALIARNIFDNDGFYPVIKEIDKTLLEALRLNNE